MGTLLPEAKTILRGWRRWPGVIALSGVILGLGIAATIAVFSVADAVLFRALPYPDADRLILLWLDNRPQGEPRDRVSFPDFLAWKERSRSFEEMAAFHPYLATLTDLGEPVQAQGAGVSAELFPLLGVEPLRGRTFTTREAAAGGGRVVVLSHRLWQRRYGGEEQIIGRAVPLNGEPHTVIGVMPPRFDFPPGSELWLPPITATQDYFRQAREARLFQVIGRLGNPATLESARREMSQIAAGLGQEFPATNADCGVSLRPLRQHLLGEVEAPLLLLLGAAALLLLIACANVANLLLIRALGRGREIAIRSACGAGRGRLARLFTLESLLLGLGSGLLGLLLAAGLVRLFVSGYPDLLPRFDEVSFDGRVLLFSLGLAVATSLLFGLAPLLTVWRHDLVEALKQGGPGHSGGRRWQRARRGFVALEIALATVLTLSAGLLVKSAWHLQRVEPGFEPEGLLTLEISLPSASYRSQESKAEFFRRALERLGALPGVTSAGASSSLLFRLPPILAPFAVEDADQTAAAEGLLVSQEAVTQGYFQTLGSRVERGRDFSAADHAGAEAVAIVNRKLARRVWGEQDPLGRRIAYWDPLYGANPPAEALVWRRVVGVVGDLRRSNLETEPPPEVFVPFTQSVRRTLRIVLRTSGDPLDLAPAARAAVWEIDAALPIADVRSFGEILSEAGARRRFNTTLLTLLSVLGLALAGAGIYGVVAYSVGRRTQEIGIHLILGARRRQVVRRVVAEGAGLIAVGLAAGLLAAWWAQRLLSGLLFEVGTGDPFVFVVGSIALAGVALLATYVPARAAARVDVGVALKTE